MTGFGKATVQLPGKKLTIEIKSLNSKQFDMAARMPSVLRELELEIRRRVASRLERGKIDLQISLENIGVGSGAATINVDAARAYKEQIKSMAKELGINEPDDWYAVLMRLPDVVGSESHSELPDDQVSEILKGVEEAIDALMAHRRSEGEKLEDFFAVRLRAITGLLSEVPRWEKERVERIHARMEEALEKITHEQIDRGRLEQEMIYYIEKLDVNEERQRLGQHLVYFAETMANPSPGQGKKLGFIAQEMGREINTLGSKSNHAEMQKLVVKMKDELEQIKEQVLNVM